MGRGIQALDVFAERNVSVLFIDLIVRCNDENVTSLVDMHVDIFSGPGSCLRWRYRYRLGKTLRIPAGAADDDSATAVAAARRATGNQGTHQWVSCWCF